MDKNFWDGKKIFITGATGLLGSWLTHYLVQTNANIVILVRDWIPRSRIFEDGDFSKINVVRGDLEDFELIKRTLNEYEIDTVFHLAAQTIVATANTNPLSTFESNIRGTWNILEACRILGTVKRILSASSDKAYGTQPVLPYTEDMPLQGEHPYDVSKSCADLLCRMYAVSYGLPVCITRCGNFYGGGDLNFNRLIPGTIRSLLNRENPVIRSDGKFIRDYIYVEDGVEAYLTLAENMLEKKLTGQSFNFSNELQLTVLDIVHKIIHLMSSNLTPDIRNTASNEIPHQYLSAEKARKALNWKPLFSLEKGLEQTIKWYTNYFRGSA